VQSCSEAYVGDEEIVGTSGQFIQVDALADKTPHGVFVKKKASPILLAKIIYHELMHYVTPKWSEDKLHNYKGVSIGKLETNEYAPQSEVDIEILAKNLTSHGLRFWTGAWDAIRERGPKE